MIVAEGIPWPCAMPNPIGEVTRVVMVSKVQSRWGFTTGLELAGLGHVGVCNGGDSRSRPVLY
jgi:hypothetical protein